MMLMVFSFVTAACCILIRICMQVNATLTQLLIHAQRPPIGAAGEAALVAALQVRCPSIDGAASALARPRAHAQLRR